MTLVFICLLATGLGLLVLTSILDDFLSFLFDGVTPALATGLGATGAIGLIGVSLTGLTDPVLMAVAASVGLASAVGTVWGWHRLRRVATAIRALPQTEELIGADARVLWWRGTTGKVLVVSPRGDQYQLTATGETDLRSGAMVTVTATAQDGVVVTNLRALPS